MTKVVKFVLLCCLFRPRLGPTASKVAVVGIVYFIMSSIEGFMRASVVRIVTNIETVGCSCRPK